MYGKMTTSRIGIMGSFLVSNFSRWVTKTALSFGAQSAPSGKTNIAAAFTPQGRPRSITLFKDNMLGKGGGREQKSPRSERLSGKAI